MKPCCNCKYYSLTDKEPPCNECKRRDKWELEKGLEYLYEDDDDEDEDDDETEWKPIKTAPKDDKIKLWYYPPLKWERINLREMILVDKIKAYGHRQPTLWMYAPMPDEEQRKEIKR